MNPNQQINRRAALAGFNAFADETRSDRLILQGSPIVYDTPAPIYEDVEGNTIFEIIERGAIAGADVSDVVLNIEHGGRVYARTRNGTLMITETETGADCRADMDANDQGHRQYYNDVKSGLLDRMSFSFTVPEDGYEYDAAARTIRVKRIDKIYDVSAVAFAAYDQTRIQSRNSEWAESWITETKNLTGQLCAHALDDMRSRAIALSYTF